MSGLHVQQRCASTSMQQLTQCMSSAVAACCRTIDAHVLIDDNVGYAMDCADAGINVLLYDWEESYPWSKLPEG
jgi:hypothetical protein